MRRIMTLLCALLLLPSLALAQAKDPIKLKVGMVAAVDMLALPIAVERGFFEKYGLDVTIARPYATGVDALNALQAGETDMVQAGVPAIGAILRGMDLVFFGNFSGNATKLGSDATLALIANGDSGIVKGDLKSLKGKKIATSFGTINHLYILGLLEKAGLAPTDVTLINTPPPEMTVALLAKGVDAFVAWDPAPVIGMKDVPGAIEVIRGGDVISYLGFNIALRPWVEKNGRDDREIPRGRVGSRPVDAQKSQAGCRHRYTLDSRAEARRCGDCDAVQHPAGGPPHFRSQLSCAMEGTGHAATAGRDQVGVRCEQAHRAQVHPQRDEDIPGSVFRPAAYSCGGGDYTGLRVQALSLGCRAS